MGGAVDKKKPAGGRAICFDFDGVIHRYISGWQGPDVIPDGPVLGIKELISRLRREKFRVLVNSARCRYSEGLLEVRKKLKEWGIVVDQLCEHKPAAMVYIDDRGLRFDGNAGFLYGDIRTVLKEGTWVEREKDNGD